jgi:hypothetical protein
VNPEPPVLKYLLLFCLVFSVADPDNRLAGQERPPDGITGQAFNITDFGAVPDGLTLNTAPIQAAIDQAHRAGGGKVIVPPGRFLSGSIHLKSNVELHLEQDAVLLGSTSRRDYKKIHWYALILADRQHNIRLTGRGTIDGQGAALAADVVRMVRTGELVDSLWSNDRPHERERPQLIEFAHCRQVRVTGLTLKNSSCWVQTYDRCDSLQIDSIRVESMAYWNNDGIDLVDCHNAHVFDCTVNTSDDGICIKSSRAPGYLPAICENIRIERCTIRSSASAFKIGTSSHGGFRNIRVRDLTIYDTYRSAITLQAVDGGFLENVEVSNVRAVNTGNAIFIRLGNRKPRRGVSSLRGVYIHDVYVEVPTGRPDSGYAFPGPEVKEPHNLFPSSIVGLPGHPVRDVRLENVEIVFGGGGRKESAYVPLDSLDQVPERAADYPEFSMFGELPAWGFYVRHVEGLEMEKVRLRLKEEDFRPALVLDDVKRLGIRKLSVKGKGGKPVKVIRKAPG